MARLGSAAASGGAEAVPKLNYWYKPALYWINVCLMVGSDAQVQRHFHFNPGTYYDFI